MWQPIETAPKDGSVLLAILPESDVPQAVRWLTKSNEDGFVGPGWYMQWDHFHLSGADHPTHWMPCPPPPAA